MWEWMVSQGLIKGDPLWYESGAASQGAMQNAIETAYKASSGDVRKELIDKLWATGKFGGNKEYWYKDRTGEIGDLGTAARALASSTFVPINGPDYTEGAEETRFNGLPGKPEIWKENETGIVYAVYYIPDSSPPIPILYSVPNDSDLESFFGNEAVAYDREISTADIDSFGSIRWSTTSEIPATGGNPWVNFKETFNRAKETQPWLNDPEVFNVFVATWLEGRDPERWELESTDWWQDRTEAQREWMWLKSRNPAEADEYFEDNITKVYDTFLGMGIETVSDELATYMAEQFTTGNWSQTRLANQMQLIFDPNRQGELEPELASFIQDRGIDVGSPSLSLNSVQAEWAKWLGPAFPPTDAQVNEWATKIRRGGEGAKSRLTTYLKAQRMAMYPEYTDPELTYQDIASPWRGFGSQIWGQQMDESSDVFQQLIKMNDTVEGAKLLRKEGMNQGIQAVEQSAMVGLFDQTSGVRKAV